MDIEAQQAGYALDQRVQLSPMFRITPACSWFNLSEAPL
jgi:hypothetical protein